MTSSAHPAVLALHGMSGNRAVWGGLTAELAADDLLAVDLPGHGDAPPLPTYSYAACATAIDAELGAQIDPVALGHSLGGVVGLALAGIRPVRAVVTVGMRVIWPAEFVAVLDALAARPARVFDDWAAAAAFVLKVSGLTGLLPPDSDFVRRGLKEDGAGWRVRQDPASFGIGVPDFEAMIGAAVAAGTHVTLVHGEHDSMVSTGDYDRYRERYGVDVVVLPGLGHNAHVEDPAAVARLLSP